MNTPGGDCSIDGCEEDASEGGFCDAHARRTRRKRRGEGGERTGLQHIPSQLMKRNQSPWRTLTEAWLAYADADAGNDEAFHRAEVRARKASLAYAKALGWAPPEESKKLRVSTVSAAVDRFVENLEAMSAGRAGD